MTLSFCWNDRSFIVELDLRSLLDLSNRFVESQGTDASTKSMGRSGC